MRSSAELSDKYLAKLMESQFSGKEHIIAQRLSFEQLTWDAQVLNLIESVIPEDLLFDFHFDMITSENRNALLNYYKGFKNGTSTAIEETKKLFSPQTNIKIDEMVDLIKSTISNKIKSISEQTAMPISADMAAQISDFTKTLDIDTSAQSQTDSSAATASQAELGTGEKKEEGSLLMDIWNALTEDQSLVGFIHLALDLLSLIGTFTTGVGGGALAFSMDLLNAIIYFSRGYFSSDPKPGMYMLGTISLISAAFFGLAPFIKWMKGSAKTAEQVLLATIKGGSKAGSEAMLRVPAKEQKATFKLLKFLSKNLAKALSWATGALELLFGAISKKLTQYSSLFAQPIARMTTRVAEFFKKVTDDLLKFVKDFDEVEKITAGIVTKNTNIAIDGLLASKYKIVSLDKVAKEVVIASRSGGQSMRIPINQFDNFIKTHRLGKRFAAKDAEAIIKYFEHIPKVNSKLADAIQKFFTKTLKVSKNTLKLIEFTGRQAMKYVYNYTDEEIAASTPEEQQFFGHAEWNSWIKDRLKRQREEKGSVYEPYADLDSTDKEVLDNFAKYQNNFAQITGQPSIIPVLYNKFKNDAIGKEFEDVWKVVEEDEAERKAEKSGEKKEEPKSNELQLDRTDKEESNKKKEGPKSSELLSDGSSKKEKKRSKELMPNESASQFKHVKSFNQFI